MINQFRYITFCLFAVALLGADASDAWKRVREGLDAYRAGDFKTADTAFEAAADLKSDDGRIPFNRGCTKAKLDDSQGALDFYRDAAADRTTGLSSEAHYNMGCLAAKQAQGVFGDDPAAADQETRIEGLRHLQTAIVHYRDSRRLDADHENSRHNLEVIRLWIKQMQAVWERKDREKEREDKNLLQFLEHIEQQQMGIRQFVKVLEKEDDSPRRRQAVIEIESKQRRLAEEILPLKEKIRAELQPDPQAAGQGSQPGQGSTNGGPGQTGDQAKQTQRVIDLLTGFADRARDGMVDSADRLESQSLSESLAAQEEILQMLSRIYMTVVPFPSMIERSIKEQEQLNDESPAATSESEEEEEEEAVVNTPETNPAPEAIAEPKPEAGSKNTASTDKLTTDDNPADDITNVDETSYEYAEAAWKQSRLALYGEVLQPKAENELQAVEAQLATVTEQLEQLPAEPELAPDDSPDHDADEDTDETNTPDSNSKDSSGEPSVDHSDTNSTSPADAANAAPPQTGSPPGGSEPTDAEKPPSEREQLEKAKQQAEQMQAALQLAMEYGPTIFERSTSATKSLTAEDATDALPNQAEALRMLKEIRDALPKDDQQQNQDGDQDQQQQDDNKQKQDQKDKQDKDQDESKDEKNEDKKNDNKDEEQNKPDDQKPDDAKQKQQKPKQQRNASRDQAEAMMRKVRERERKHRELLDELRGRLIAPGQVERDW